jgi:hypothetical protein
VVPITLMGNPSQPYTMLKGYKSNWLPTQQRFAVQVAALHARLLIDHAECITEWDVVTHVPSKGRHSGKHPLAAAMERVPWLHEQHETLLKPGPGVSNIGRAMAVDDGFEPTRDVRGLRVVLLDDTWTSGATAQSAASALSLAGAEVLAIAPVGRLVNPRKGSAEDEEWWAEQQREPFDFATCTFE